MSLLGKKWNNEKKKLPLNIEEKLRHILILSDKIAHHIILQ